MQVMLMSMRIIRTKATKSVTTKKYLNSGRNFSKMGAQMEQGLMFWGVFLAAKHMAATYQYHLFVNVSFILYLFLKFFSATLIIKINIPLIKSKTSWFSYIGNKFGSN